LRLMSLLSDWDGNRGISRLLDSLISPEILASGEANATRARILLVMVFALSGSASWAAVYQAVWGEPALAIFGVAATGGALLVLPALRRASSLQLPASLLIGILFLAISGAAIGTSGRGPAGIIFLTAIPLVAAVVSGGRAALGWTLLVLFELILLRWMFEHVPPLVLPNPAAVETAHLRASTFVSIVILIAALLYETLTSHSLIESEKARKEKAASEARYRSLVAASPDGLFASQDEKIIFASQALLDLLGYEDERTLIGQSLDAILFPTDVPRSPDARRSALPHREYIEILNVDGVRIPADLTSSAFEFDGESAEIHIVRDIRTEREAERERALIRAAVDQSRDGIAILGADSRHLYANDAYFDLAEMKSAEVLGFPFPTIGRNSSTRRLLTDLASQLGDEKLMSLPRITEGGIGSGQVVVDVRGFPISSPEETEPRAVIFLRDESSVVSLEAQLEQTRRIESIGKLAGGIAHDSNNMLTVILGELGALEDEGDDADSRQEHINVIRDVCLRSAEMNRQILAFGRKQVLHPEHLDLNQVITDLEPILRRTVPERIHLEFDLRTDLPLAHFDASQIGQALVNLVSNAKDAIAEEGTVRISTEGPGEPNDHERDRESDDEPMIALLVTDDGAGIPSSDLDSVFDPFFTTKSTGKGTGLGLATVHGIVHQSSGSIDVRSTPGKSTTFRILLPARYDTLDEVEITPTPVDPLSSPTSIHRILLAEDDANVRSLLATRFRKQGFEVAEACDATEASRIIEKATTAFDALVSDVVMPGGGGLALSDTFRARFPNGRILLMSGYPQNELGRIATLDSSIRFVAKPVTPREILSALLA